MRHDVEFFVDENSIVRKIWGNSDTILFIFAGAAAEFALNKAVDWLYFTGKLPSDPLGRLFSTVGYARKIVFSEKEDALKAIDSIAAIHSAVENKRGAKIPEWAYRDVLFMLVDYSIRAFEILERKLTPDEKHEAFDVFNRVGTRMGISGLPDSFDEWVIMRQQHIEENLVSGEFTTDLFRQYRKHLGLPRYAILIEAQTMIVPESVGRLLKFKNKSFLTLLLMIYKPLRKIGVHEIIRYIIQPSKYRSQINDLNAGTM